MLYNFKFSMSVLDHLWRKLYRNFITVLWEAISNAWDADATCVWIEIDKENWNFLVIDNWIWMTEDDFQNKFLKIWYSKRKDWTSKSAKWRARIWRKWIWKLALLSCSREVTIITKTSGWITWWTINNIELDEKIKENNDTWDYVLSDINIEQYGDKIEKLWESWTILCFSQFNDEVRNSIEYLRELIALNFRFSLYDNDFKIFLNNEEINFSHLEKLANNTEFIRKINLDNDNQDPYLQLLWNIKKSSDITIGWPRISWFIASVRKPSDLKIFWTWEKTTIDLFVNWRIRDKDILRHIPTSRIVENYLYWQLSFDQLDDWNNEDVFTSNREWIINNDPQYQDFLNVIKNAIINKVVFDWDDWRVENREDWDSENEAKLTKKERKSKELFNQIAKEYIPIKKGKEVNQNSGNIVEEWVNELSSDAEHNFSSYWDAFVSENLLRKYIEYKSIKLSEESIRQANEYKVKENKNKNKWNISIQLRQKSSDIYYLDMDWLSNLIEKQDLSQAWLNRSANEYKPMRDAMAHTALLTNEAKCRLHTVFDNIKWRIITLLNSC